MRAVQVLANGMGYKYYQILGTLHATIETGEACALKKDDYCFMRALRFSCRQKYYYLERSSYERTQYFIRRASQSQPILWELPRGRGAKIWGNGMPSIIPSLVQWLRWSGGVALMLGAPQQAGVEVVCDWRLAGFSHLLVHVLC